MCEISTHRLTVEVFSSELMMFCPVVTDKLYSALCLSLKFGHLDVKEVCVLHYFNVHCAKVGKSHSMSLYLFLYVCSSCM